MDPIETLAARVRVPAIHLVHATEASRSHLGGDPRLPTGLEWPCHPGRRLDFLARLSLVELARACPIDWLPRQGALLFFYDIEEGPWGCSPQDRDGWAVLHVDDLPEPLSLAGAEEEGGGMPRRALACRAIGSLPSIERPALDHVDFSDHDADRYEDMRCAVFGGAPMHQVAGMPMQWQDDDMELQCQLVSHGADFGNPGGRDHPGAKALAADARDWRLLLQFDGDDSGWGCLGNLYFWVREQEAAAGRFDKVWLVLQCT